MKQDLDFIFKRIRTIKAKLQQKHPENYSNAVNKIRAIQDPNDVEDETFETSLISEEEAAQVNKPRSSTNESNEGSTSSVINDIIQTARERINSTGLIASIYNSTPQNQHN